LSELEPIDFTSRGGSPLKKLCAVGVKHAWNELERTTKSSLLQVVGGKAKASLRRHLQRTLEQITEPSLELEWKSFILAMESLGFGQGSAEVTQRMFLREKPSYRLGPLFQRFPVLAGLWILAIDQWRNHIAEILKRVRKDRNAISRCFFEGRPLGVIRNIYPGLSDPHRGGRSVTLVEFDSGHLIYKPRSGRSETRWFELLAWMNRHGFSPKLRIARILERSSYSWMEFVEVASCKDKAGVRRFYERLGAMIAVAYLLKAVDCHRENVIAAGEHPVLVDVDALWHVSPLTKTQSLTHVLYRTGFFPGSKRRSLQSRSSVLGYVTTGKHVARMTGRPEIAGDYAEEIVLGFSQAWRSLVGTARRRSAFQKALRQIWSQRRRWIYLATETYAAILRAAFSPQALQSEAAREAVIKRLCSRGSVKRVIVQAEIKALKQLDLPYFVRKTAEPMPADRSTVPAELIQAIRHTLPSAGRDRRKS
jgi:lantibiotic modifying enzyme